MHKDLERVLGSTELDLTPLALVMKLVSCGLPVALIANAETDKFSVIYKGIE